MDNENLEQSYKKINDLIALLPNCAQSDLDKAYTDIELQYYYNIKDYKKAFEYAKLAYMCNSNELNLSNLRFCIQMLDSTPKIIVYTIMKNEIDNIDAWIENVKDADGIYVLDTGSTDGSFEKMAELTKKYPNLSVLRTTYEFFRFDEARNDNLAMVPEDFNTICWTIDLDERFCDGWYEKTLDSYTKNKTFYKLEYWYTILHDADGNDVSRARYNKCHRRLGANWTLPIHEVLSYGIFNPLYDGGIQSIDDSETIVHHYQNEDTDREQYIGLLNQRITEDKYDFEAMNHLATEYRFHKVDFQAELDTRMTLLGRGIIGNSTWKECMAGNIGGMLVQKDFIAAGSFYELAISYNPTLRTYYVAYAQELCEKAIELNNKTYAEKAIQLINSMYIANTVVQESWKEMECSWTWGPHLVLGKSYYVVGNRLEASRCFRTILEMENIDIKIKEEAKMYYDKIHRRD